MAVIDFSAPAPRCCPHCDVVVRLEDLWRHIGECAGLAAKRAPIACEVET